VQLFWLATAMTFSGTAHTPRHSLCDSSIVVPCDYRFSPCSDTNRELSIVRGPNGYGFNLARINEMNIFRVVDEGGPAWNAGGRPGDRILEVGTPAVHAGMGRRAARRGGEDCILSLAMST